ncbi:MAG: TrmB family transcriptional regulator [Candidatus Heimdallarchaeota archaeon]|nr:TrmB family transcriptional regulator [Candidatus Heimdallarchaeota archaeon]
MSSGTNEKLIQALISLGLPRWEAQTYVALYQHGLSEATPLARKANIPQPKIYTHLGSLETKGFITKTEIVGKPHQYIAMNHEVVLSELRKNLMNQLTLSAQFFEELEIESSELNAENYFNFAQGINPVRIAIRDIISEAKNNIYILPNENFSIYSDAFDRAVSDHPDDLEVVFINERLMKFTHIFSRLTAEINPDSMKRITKGRPLLIIKDVDVVNKQASSVSIITPQVDNFDPVMFQIRHPMIVNFQVGLLLGLLEIMETIVPRLFMS